MYCYVKRQREAGPPSHTNESSILSPYCNQAVSGMRIRPFHIHDLRTASAIELILPGVNTVAQIITESQMPHSPEAPAMMSRPRAQNLSRNLLPSQGPTFKMTAFVFGIPIHLHGPLSLSCQHTPKTCWRITRGWHVQGTVGDKEGGPMDWWSVSSTLRRHWCVFASRQVVEKEYWC